MKRPAFLPLAVTLAGIALVGVSAIAHPRPHLVWNASASVAAGLYRVISGAPERGDFVLVRIPKSIESLAAMRGYLPAGIPLIKRIAAVAGDDVRAFDGSSSSMARSLPASARRTGQGGPCRAGTSAGNLSRANSSFWATPRTPSTAAISGR